jgi:hypothetical protein
MRPLDGKLQIYLLVELAIFASRRRLKEMNRTIKANERSP